MTAQSGTPTPCDAGGVGVQDPERGTQAPQAAAAPAATPRALSYDPAYREAVASGRLTVRQAVERGNRSVHAANLCQKHGLSMDLAYLVTDNRMPLVQALRTAAAQATDQRARSGAAGAGLRALLAILLGIVALAGVVIWRVQGSDAGPEGTPGAPAAASRAAQGTTESSVRATPSGEVTEITAPNPTAVLDLFCRSTRGVDRRERVRVVASREGDAIGVFREAGAHYSIRIRKDSRTGLSVAGNGQTPIVPERTDAPLDTD